MKKNHRFWVYLLVVLGLFIMLLTACDKDDHNDKNQQVPILTTSVVSNITDFTATSGGNVTSEGGTTVTARGVCWSTQQNPTIEDSITIEGTGAGSFTSTITDLIPYTTYYVRAYATNSTGTGYGSTMPFTTLQVTDIDGNVYTTVTIGTQVWMVENLKVTSYNDSTPIANVTDNIAWINLTSGAYCWYNNNGTIYKNPYGALYNWFTVSTLKLCPTGWHVPTDAEWTILTDYLGGSSEAGGKLKETGTTHWNSPNNGATNETGFTALPGGYRHYDATFNNIGNVGHWWSLTMWDPSMVYGRGMDSGSSLVKRDFYFKVAGLSVRCLRD